MPGHGGRVGWREVELERAVGARVTRTGRPVSIGTGEEQGPDSKDAGDDTGSK
ncbi:MAG: hypothetical protein WEA24_14935 [Gemmatimonadota bacterium]